MKILIVILLVGALGAGGWFYTQRQRAGAVPQVSTKVDTAVIETRNIKFAINAAGDITPAEQVSVRPEVNGKIEVLPVDVGDRVKSGQLLFKLDDRELQTQRQQEDKNVERSRLQLG